jgi:hypothetical protein
MTMEWHKITVVKSFITLGPDVLETSWRWNFTELKMVR